MSIKSYILHQLILLGGNKSRKKWAHLDPSKYDQQEKEKDIIKGRADIHRFSSLVSWMSKSIQNIVSTPTIRAGVPTFTLSPKSPNDKVIIYLHGGGHVFQLASYHHIFGARIAEATNARVCIVDYRLAPENPFPAALDDVYAVYMDYLQGNYDPKKIVILGDSAGGNLALALLMKIKQEGSPMPGAVIPISARTGGDLLSEMDKRKGEEDPILSLNLIKWFTLLYIGTENLDDPLARPILGDFTGCPPMLILVGGKEIILSDSLNLAKKAQEAGVDVTLDVNEEMFHVYPVFVDILDEAKIALGKIALFIQMKIY